MRAISKADVLETFADLYDVFEDNKAIRKELDKVYDRLNALPSVTPEPHWIPCSERLPETHKAGNSVSGIFMQSKPVLVYGVPEYESEYSFNVVTYCDDLNGITYWSTEMDAVTINEVTAWMPLPESYQGEGE